jgi:hypothetical protein
MEGIRMARLSLKITYLQGLNLDVFMGQVEVFGDDDVHHSSAVEF